MASHGQDLEARTGIFITLEGGEGAGKTTLAGEIASRLRQRGVTCILTREPGGSPRAEAIREGLLAGDAVTAGPFAEAVLFYAARLDHLETRIRPALERGDWVICDRFADSTRAYQGAVGKFDSFLLDGLDQAVVGPDAPDLTLVVDVPVAIGLSRARQRAGTGAADRFEREDEAFHVRLREAFLAIAREEPARCVVIDGAMSAAEVADAAWAVIVSRLGHRLAVADQRA